MAEPLGRETGSTETVRDRKRVREQRGEREGSIPMMIESSDVPCSSGFKFLRAAMLGLARFRAVERPGGRVFCRGNIRDWVRENVRIIFISL